VDPSDLTKLDAFVAKLELPLSAERLAAYSTASDPLAAITDYLWNIELSAALYPLLNGTETALRNSLHTGLAARYGTDDWFDATGALATNELDEVNETRASLTRRNKPANAGRVVAELRYSFWVKLLSDSYDAPMWQPHQYELLKIVFPNLPRALRARPTIHSRFNATRFLRNRVAHHEAIYRRPHLMRDHANLVEAIGWISTELHGVIALIDRFPDTHAHGRGRIEAALRTHLEIP